MRLVLDSNIAFEYWMCASVCDDALLVKTPHPRLTEFEDFEHGGLSRALKRTDGVRGPLHLLVASPRQRRPAKGVVCHAWTQTCPFPPESLYEVGDDLYVESPELCLVRLAATLPRLEFYRSLSDMLGVYTFSFTKRIDLIQREPVTTVKKIRHFLQVVERVRGTKPLRNALKWIIPRSASPRETSMNLMLAMPSRSGGYGLPRFEANYKIDLEGDARLLTTKQYLVADAMWPDSSLALEYNSSKYHDTEEQKEFDFEKITALQNIGHTVTPISTRQFNSHDAFDAIVRTTQRRLGLRAANLVPSEAVRERRRATHEELLRIERRSREQPSLATTARWRYLLPRINLYR